jgi:hypothetical protein
MTAALRIEKLRREHAVDTFDCGYPELNRFLQRFALTNQQAGAAQSYVALAGNEVIGYYSSAASLTTGIPVGFPRGVGRRICAQLKIGATTLPWTSVRRWWRPWYWKVNFV